MTLSRSGQEVYQSDDTEQDSGVVDDRLGNLRAESQGDGGAVSVFGFRRESGQANSSKSAAKIQAQAADAVSVAPDLNRKPSGKVRTVRRIVVDMGDS
ncbi:MAG: hypothetical protein OEZ19_11240 [Paracoccaceae bacterium]|nr:hypothetical protein [Paracoccaceae bacterium]